MSAGYLIANIIAGEGVVFALAMIGVLACLARIGRALERVAAALEAKAR